MKKVSILLSLFISILLVGCTSYDETPTFDDIEIYVKDKFKGEYTISLENKSDDTIECEVCLQKDLDITFSVFGHSDEYFKNSLFPFESNIYDDFLIKFRQYYVLNNELNIDSVYLSKDLLEYYIDLDNETNLLDKLKKIIKYEDTIEEELSTYLRKDKSHEYIVIINTGINHYFLSELKGLDDSELLLKLKKMK